MKRHGVALLLCASLSLGGCEQDKADDNAAQATATATGIVDAIWPEGSVSEALGGSTGILLDNMMAMQSQAAIMQVIPTLTPEQRQKLSDMQPNEVLTLIDPDYAEKRRIVSEVMNETLDPILLKQEPQLKNALAASFDRHLDQSELAAAADFFSTEQGRQFGEKLMLIYTDSEYLESTQAMQPDIQRAAPAMMEKIDDRLSKFETPDPQAMKKRVDDYFSKQEQDR